MAPVDRWVHLLRQAVLTPLTLRSASSKLMSKIKIGFLGAGYIAGVHGAILARDERVEVASVHDLVREQAEQFARSTGAGVARTTSTMNWRSSPPKPVIMSSAKSPWPPAWWTPGVS